MEARSCLSGPHKDDLAAWIDGQPARQFASQGQTRTAALSLKLAERELFEDDTGQWPVLLLDDVLSELDARRQDFVLDRITGGQVFITSCEAPAGEISRGKTLHIHQVVSVGEDLPKSFLLCRNQAGRVTVYLSQLSSATLLRRVESGRFETI